MYTTIKDKQVPAWKQEGPCRDRLKLAVVFLIIIVIGFMVTSHFRIYSREQWYSVSREERPLAEVMLPAHEKVDLKEIICKTHHDLCYYVVDADYGNGATVRRLQIEPHHHTILCGGLVDSSGVLIADNIWMSYARLVLQTPYVLGIFDGKSPKNVLQIGLGGGVTGAFLETLPEGHRITSVELEPVIAHIARKWFNVPKSPKHTVIVADGLEYVADYPTGADRFDFAIVDTSYDDDFHLMMSPVALFGREKFAEQLRALMNPDGCAVAVNTYTHHEDLEKLLDAEKFRHDMLQIYRRFFGSCFFNESGANNILMCSCKDMGEMLQDRYERLWRQAPDNIREQLRVKYLIRSDW